MASAASSMAAELKKAGPGAMKAAVESVQGMFADSKPAAAGAREAGLIHVKVLAEELGPRAEPYLMPLLPTILELAADKSPAVKTAADLAVKALIKNMCPQAVKLVIPVLFEGMQNRKKWQAAEASLKTFNLIADRAPVALAQCLPDMVGPLTETLGDSKEQVRTAAESALMAACKCIVNKDLEQFVPALVASLARPETEVPECVHKLSATTFVQEVTSVELSIMVPLLQWGLKDRATAIKRKSAVIIENMSKLVDDPVDAVPFLPKLLPLLELNAKNVSDPECRSVTGRAHVVLAGIGKEAETLMAKVSPPTTADNMAVVQTLKKCIPAKSAASVDEKCLEYVGSICAQMIGSRRFIAEEWSEAVVPYLSPLSAKDAQAVATSFLNQCAEDVPQNAAQEDEEEGEDLCKCEFSLAYGAKILLNNTKLHLKRGKRYGLCGPNGCGKSTLMRAIANGQVEGFPPPDELRTVYVEHDLDASVADDGVLDFMANDEKVAGVSRQEITEMLSSVGFTDVMQASPVGSLSGGWKMKLALARAMLMKADILLLDEPTNHLDVKNVAWLENYLCSLTTVSSIIVSHDTGFLDHVCTHILHYEARKLRCYRGNLSAFVKVKPEAQVYYELDAGTSKFVFPEPGYLEGIKTKDRAILKMQRVQFTYPGTEKQVLYDITIYCTLSSRVAIVGPNGAGKSTMVKLLTGELETDQGTVWKHPNLRIAYVAQHAFHHIEQHLDKTPNEYIQWRYAGGEDREDAEKVSRQISEEESKKMEEKVVINGTKRVVDKILGRRKLKKTYEYEVQWQNSTPDMNSWLTRDALEDMGFVKLVNEVDAKEAARLGMFMKPLTQAGVQKHLDDVGLEPEFATHSRIRGLSGGQKVKLVIAAAMWNNPHMLVLDEPTNYLDRESLGALAGAIRAYGGGVLMVSHNREFTDALANETWEVNNGRLTALGEPAWLNAAKIEIKQVDEVTDAFGNTIKIKAPPKKLSRKEQKAREKSRKARRDNGEVVSEDEEEL